MRRSGRNRWTGLLVGALWCAAVAARPTLIACPMGAHHGGASDVSSAVDAHAAHAAAGHTHQSDGVRGEESPTPTPDAPAHGTTPCDCLGDCCATSIVVPGALSSTIVLSFTDPDPQPGLPQHEFVGLWIDFVLPFATAPPSMVTG